MFCLYFVLSKDLNRKWINKYTNRFCFFCLQRLVSTVFCTSEGFTRQRPSQESHSMTWAFSWPQTPNWRTISLMSSHNSKVRYKHTPQQHDLRWLTITSNNHNLQCLVCFDQWVIWTQKDWDPVEMNVMLMLVSAEWLFECTVQKLVVVITCLETNEVLERWQFDIECDKTAKESRYLIIFFYQIQPLPIH